MTTRPPKRPGDEPVTTAPPADATVTEQPPTDAPSTDGTPSTPDVPAAEARKAPDDTPADAAPADEAPAGLTPAWDPDDVEIEGRDSALETAQQIAADLGYTEPDGETTTETEEA